MNADLLTDIDYRKLIEFHLHNKAIATVATHKRHVRLELGVIETIQKNGIDQVVSFVEKPEYDFNVSMGIYILDPRIMDYIPPDQPFGFDQLIFHLLEATRTGLRISIRWALVGYGEHRAILKIPPKNLKNIGKGIYPMSNWKIPLFTPDFSSADWEAACAPIRDAWLTMGQRTSQFEQAFINRTGRPARLCRL